MRFIANLVIERRRVSQITIEDVFEEIQSKQDRDVAIELIPAPKQAVRRQIPFMLVDLGGVFGRKAGLAVVLVREVRRGVPVAPMASWNLLASDALGASGRQMLAAISAGQNRPERLAKLAHGRLWDEIPRLGIGAGRPGAGSPQVFAGRTGEPSRREDLGW